MSYKPHRAIRPCKTHIRKFNGKCECCNKSICSCRAYQYIDDSNGAITNNAPYLCKDCYENKYGVRIKTDVEAFRDRIADMIDKVSESGGDIYHRIANFIREQEEK